MRRLGGSVIGIVVIGNEILSGQVRDSNLAYMLQQLARVGFTVTEVRMVRDDTAAIAEALLALSGRCEHVFSCGGVGPTHDDVTLEAYGLAFARPMVQHPDLLFLLERYYGSPLTPGQARMAWVPEGTECLAGTPDSWPVPKLGNCWALPGLPEAFRRKLDALLDSLPPPLPTWYGHLLTSETESAFAEELRDLQAAHAQVELGSYPKSHASYRTKITVKGKDRAVADKALIALELFFARRGSLAGKQEIGPYQPGLEG